MFEDVITWSSLTFKGFPHYRHKFDFDNHHIENIMRTFFSYFCFLPDSTTTPPPKGELITIYNIYRSLCRSYIVLRWTQEKLYYFLTFQTRNNALNHLEILMFSLVLDPYFSSFRSIFVWKSRIKFGNWIRILQIYIYIYIESSVWRALRRDTQSHSESMHPLSFFNLYIHTHIFVWKSRGKFGNWIQILQNSLVHAFFYSILTYL